MTAQNSASVLWEENDTPPTLALEMVSHAPGGEYDKKLEIYRKLGVLYYVIYNPKHWQRDGHQPFEAYKLIKGVYQLQLGKPFWMPELSLGIGRRSFLLGGLVQEGLGWVDGQGRHYLDDRELLAQKEQERQRLAAKLRELGVDPDEL